MQKCFMSTRGRLPATLAGRFHKPGVSRLPTRVIQWGTGAVGSLTLKQIIEDPELELAGVLVYSDAKVGKDAGELAGLATTGILATKNRVEILALDADVVIHTPLAPSMAEMDQDVLDLLSSGKNVISTAGYFAPQVRGQELVDRINEACCMGGGTSLHGRHRTWLHVRSRCADADRHVLLDRPYPHF